MGSPPIPDRSPPPQSPKRPAGKLTSINFSPPKRRTASLKGKERALEDNSYPAEIQVSYRHLLGKANGGPSCVSRLGFVGGRGRLMTRRVCCHRAGTRCAASPMSISTLPTLRWRWLYVCFMGARVVRPRADLHLRRSGLESIRRSRSRSNSGTVSCAPVLSPSSNFWSSFLDEPQIAVNYPARVFGITRHESPADALKKCPHLMFVSSLAQFDLGLMFAL